MEPFAAAARAELEALPASAPDLWERIVAGYAIPDINGPLVEKWERWYADRPEYVARMVERSRRYLYHIVSEVTGRAWGRRYLARGVLGAIDDPGEVPMDDAG